jgi:hypothetical protein
MFNINGLDMAWIMIDNITYLTNSTANVRIARNEMEDFVEFLARQFKKDIAQRLKRILAQH